MAYTARMTSKNENFERDNARLQGLMQRVAEKRDQQAFSELFDHFAPLLKGFSYNAQPGANFAADELVQEVMIRVWQKAGTYKPEKAAVSTWVYTLARNYRIDQLRKNARRQNDLDIDAVWQDLEDEDCDPFELAQQQKNAERVHACIEKLPMEQARVVHCVYMEGKSHSEVAEELGLPLGTVKSRLRLAMQKMEPLITGSGAEPEAGLGSERKTSAKVMTLRSGESWHNA